MSTQSLNIPDEDIKKLDKIAKIERRSKSWIASESIREYWEKHYETNKKSRS